MAKLTSGDVAKLAYLARLKLTDDELAAYTAELSAILGYVEQLESVNTSGLEPTYQVTGLANVVRADEVSDSQISQAELFKNLPAVQDSQIKVRRMIA